MKTMYEWSVCYLDEHGDIADLHHADTLAELRSIIGDDAPETYKIELVRNTFAPDGNLVERTWAELESAGLTLWFRDANGTDCYRVPKRFIMEVK